MSDQETLRIVKQACLKAAGNAVSAGTVGIPQDEIAARTVAIAEYFLEWVYSDKQSDYVRTAVSNVVQAFQPQSQSQAAPQAPQQPSNAVPTSCPKCGCKVQDNRADNMTRAEQGRPLRPNFACNGKWKREADGSFTQIQKECGWVVWPEKTNA